MSWKVMSNRLAWSTGTVLSADDLAGCNIAALVQSGHLAPFTRQAEPITRSKRMPVEPVDDKTADEPEEQE